MAAFVERARVENGGMVGPRIYQTGTIIYGAGAGGYHNDVADMEDAKSALVRIKVEGGPASFSYKNYNQYSRCVMAPLIWRGNSFQVGFSQSIAPETTSRGTQSINAVCSRRSELRKVSSAIVQTESMTFRA